MHNVRFNTAHHDQAMALLLTTYTIRKLYIGNKLNIFSSANGNSFFYYCGARKGRSNVF